MATDIGVALVLPPEVEGVAYTLAERVGNNVALEHVLNPEYLPHLTLYQGRFLQERLDPKWVIGMMRRARSFTSSGIFVTLLSEIDVRPNGNLSWGAEKSPSLIQVHIAVAEYLQAKTILLRSRAQVQRNERGTPKDVRERIAIYGTDRAGRFHFAPHVTLGRIAKEERTISPELRSFPGEAMRFTAVKIAIGQIAEDGRMRRDHLHLIEAIN